MVRGPSLISSLEGRVVLEVAVMKCDSCGAPLKLVPGRDYYYCAYCTTFHYPPAADPDADGVTSLGEAAEADCPICKVKLVEGSIEGRPVAFCEQCRGVCISNDYFGDVVWARRSRHTGPSDQPRPINQEELARRVDCPTCGREMDVYPYYGPGSVVIDSCQHCKMVWLDRGELAAIERAPGRREA